MDQTPIVLTNIQTVLNTNNIAAPINQLNKVAL
jgi:hypothetical protein